MDHESFFFHGALDGLADDVRDFQKNLKLIAKCRPPIEAIANFLESKELRKMLRGLTALTEAHEDRIRFNEGILIPELRKLDDAVAAAVKAYLEDESEEPAFDDKELRKEASRLARLNDEIKSPFSVYEDINAEQLELLGETGPVGKAAWKAWEAVLPLDGASLDAGDYWEELDDLDLDDFSL